MVQQIGRWLIYLFAVGSVAGLVIGLISYAVLSRELPSFERIEDYRPPIESRAFAQDGQLIGEFFRERRVLVNYERIPRRIVQALLASEDDRFFDHNGIDYLGILRAAFANFKAGRVVQGGSTITQQVAKSLIIQAEGYKQGTAKKLSRKIKEAILAKRLEESLSKEEILTLYLNQVFLGNHSYGIQTAAENYFRKNVEDLNLAEMALLAGLPQAPSRYSPFRYPERARKRRIYVLRRMREEGFITQAELDDAEQTKIRVYGAPNTSRNVTPYFTEHIRRWMLKQYGEKTVQEGGLSVWTSVDVERYRAAEGAIYDKLRLVDKRQGFRGPLLKVTTKAFKREFFDRYDKELMRLGRLEALEHGELYLGLITKIDRKKQRIHLRIGPHRAVLPLAAMRWARKVNPQEWFESSLLNRIPKTFKVGDVLHVRTTKYSEIKKDKYAAAYLKLIPKSKGDRKIQLVSLEQSPNLEAALMSVDVKSGYVLAMIGGYSFARSEFNRAVQACRQPGSSFKPIVYSAAIALNGWNASTTILDAPLVADDPEAGRRWKPKNFGHKYLGEVTLRTALKNSMNVPAIKIMAAVGVREVIRWAHKLGITSKLPPELGLALGAGCVIMADLVEVYRVFPSYGARSPRRFVTRVTDRDGKVLYEDPWYRDPWIGIGRKAEAALKTISVRKKRQMSAQDAYLTTRLMRNVVNEGTGVGAQKLGVPVAGKTGTTNDSFDAWFVGFTTDIVTAAWVGYDDYVLPMGRHEQGGRAALPIWLAYMQRAIKGKKSPEFPPPRGVVMVRIDPETGKLAPPEATSTVIEAYKIGEEPTEYAKEAFEADLEEFGKEDNF
jgi:penicillin-binding protein 1A